MERSKAREVGMLAALWLALGGWIGGLVLLGAVVAPAAFRVLPTTALAGDLVGAVLGALHLYGIAAGVALAWLAGALGRGRALVALPLGLAGLCVVSQFGVSAAIDQTRALAFGDPADAAARTRFALLHLVSVAIFAATAVGAIVLAVLHARAQVHDGRVEPVP